MNLGLLVKNYPEKYFGRLFSRIFWPPPSVAVLVHGENDDILALNLGGEYRLPGGLIEAGEGPREAAKREVKEETGFEIELANILDIRTHNKGGFTIFFEGYAGKGKEKNTWEGKTDFVPKGQVKEKVWDLNHSHIHEYLFPEE